MRISKLSKKDFKSITNFNQACEAMLEREKFSMKEAYENWKDWPDDDEDKKEILKVRKSIALYEHIDEADIDDRIVAYEYLRSKYTHRMYLSSMTAEVLIDNCCDTTKDYLDFHPSFQQIHVAAEQ